MPRKDLVSPRGGTAALWASRNPVLAYQELGSETDTKKMKIGDGTTHWNGLPYVTGPVDGDNVELQVKRDTDANLSAITTPFLSGQLVYGQTTGALKIGNGVSTWPELSQINSDASFTVVAASDSNTKKKAHAEYFCSGVDDHIIIQEALDDYGYVKLLPGTFITTDDMTVPVSGSLMGCGIGKTIILQSKDTVLTYGMPIITLSSYSICSNLTVNGNGWTDQDIDTNGVALRDYSTIQNCEIKESRQYNIYTSGATGAKIIGNYAHHSKYPICLRGEGNETIESQWSDRCMVCWNHTSDVEFYIKLRATKNSTIANNMFYVNNTPTNMDQCGVTLDGIDSGFKNIIIDHNTIIDTIFSGNDTKGIHAIPHETTTNVVISNNLIVGFTIGIENRVNDAYIYNNTIKDSVRSGIYNLSGDGAIIKNNKIVNCGIQLNNSNNITIDNNTINGGSPYWRANNSGIFVWNQFSAAVTGNKITNNEIYNCLGNGIFLSKQSDVEGYPTNTSIFFNYLHDNATPLYNTSPGTAIIKYNPGYVTENIGTATIPASGASIVVNHGLVAAPTKYFAFPSANLGNCWIDTVTATQMTIHCETAPASDTLVSWSAEV